MKFKCDCGYTITEKNVIVDVHNLLKVDSNGIINLTGLCKCPECHKEYDCFLEMEYAKNKSGILSYIRAMYGFNLTPEQLDSVMTTDKFKTELYDDTMGENVTGKFDFADNSSIWQLTIYE